MIAIFRPLKNFSSARQVTITTHLNLFLHGIMIDRWPIKMPEISGIIIYARICVSQLHASYTVRSSGFFGMSFMFWQTMPSSNFA